MADWWFFEPQVARPALSPLVIAVQDGVSTMLSTLAKRRPLIVLGTLALLMLLLGSALGLQSRPASAGPTPPGNDDFTGAIVIGSLPYSNAQSTEGATEEVSEPLTTCAMSTTVWYTFTPSTDLLMQADTVEADFSHRVALYTGNDLASLTAEGCHEPIGTTASLKFFTASAGVTYYFQIGTCVADAGSPDPACDGNGGNLVFNLEGSGIPEMALNIKGGNCDDASQPTECDVPVGSLFTLSVDADPVPYPGYTLLQSFIDYGTYFPGRTEDPGATDDPLTTNFVEGPGPCDDGIDNGGDAGMGFIGRDRFDEDCVDSDLVYKPATAASDEIIWPDCSPQTAVRIQFGPALLGHGCISGTVPPLFHSPYTGNAIEMDFTCSSEVSTSEVRLVAAAESGSLDPIALTSGAQFSRNFPPRLSVLVGPDNIQVIPEVSTLIVNCVEVAVAAVGGIAQDAELRSLPLETTAGSGSAPWAVAAAAVFLTAAGGAAWYARRRRA